MKALILTLSIAFTLPALANTHSLGRSAHSLGRSFAKRAANRQETTLYCGSDRYKYNTCPVGFPIHQLYLANQASDAPCKEGHSYGQTGASIWVNHGCRGNFLVRGPVKQPKYHGQNKNYYPKKKHHPHRKKNQRDYLGELESWFSNYMSTSSSYSSGFGFGSGFGYQYGVTPWSAPYYFGGFGGYNCYGGLGGGFGSYGGFGGGYSGYGGYGYGPNMGYIGY